MNLTDINPIQDGPFRGFLWMGGAKSSSPENLSHISYKYEIRHNYTLRKKNQKKYMNHVTQPLSSADISIFSLEITKFCYIRKYIYRLEFRT